MRLAYVTAEVPWGKSEQFVLTEIRAVVGRGHDVIVVPVRPHLTEAWPDGEDLRPYALAAPLFAPRYLAALGFWALRRPLVLADLLRAIVLRSGGAKRMLKNFAVLPKAADVARVLERRRIEHVHAHWATTPATLALIASRLGGIPWSFTAHQWDITDRNLLADKVAAASFARVISEDGRREFVEYLSPAAAGKLRTIYMGVEVPAAGARPNGRGGERPRIVVPARLHEKKGHAYVFEALAILRAEYRRSVRCLVVGDGPLRDQLTALRRDLGLAEEVEFVGQLPHDELMKLYAQGGIAAVVHPSVVAADGEREGIPVALMEAMAFGIPVVTTPNGGIEELVDGAGLLVPERDAPALAGALADLLANESFASEMGTAGRRRIEERFAADVVVQRLEASWRESVPANGGDHSHREAPTATDENRRTDDATGLGPGS